MQLDEQLSAPNERRRIVAAAVWELRRRPLPDMLVSSGTEALVLTSLLAGELGLPMAYLRPKPKSHGRQQRVEGKLHGSSLTLVAVNPTADTVQDNLDLVAESGARISRLLALGPAPAVDGLEVLRLVPATSGPSPADLPPPTPVTSAAHMPSASSDASPEDAMPSRSSATPEDVATILLDIGAVIIRSEPFRYASGLLSPIYTDCRLLISHPDRWPAIVEAFVQRLEKGNDFEAIDGVATSGIPHASLLAQRLDKRLAYASEDKVVGSVQPDDRLVIVEDLVTTGKSVLEAAVVLRSAGLRADRCLAIFTYNREQPVLKEAGIDFEPLSDLDILLDTGLARGYFGADERQAVLDWRQDPQAWTASHEPQTTP